MTTATTQIIISGKDQLSGVAADAGRRLGTELQAMQRGAAALSNVFAGLGAAIGGLGITQMAREVFQAGVAMDALQRSFLAVSGSQAMAAAELSFLREEAGRLGQSFYDLAPQYKQLAAAARNTSLEGEQARKIFSSVTAAAAALGLGAGETSGALNALAQMISKGNVQAEELRGQLGERLPGAFSLAAKAMGVSTQELNKMLDSGQVLAVDLLPKLAAELERVYGNAAQTAALESAQAAVNRMSEEWTNLKNNLFHSESAVVGIGMVTQALAGLNAMISNVQQGKVQWIWEGLQMEATDPSKYRGKVNRDMVMPAYVAPAVSPAATVAAPSGTGRAQKASAAAHEKMIEDGKKAAEALDKYWQDYEDRRVEAITGGVTERQKAAAQEKAVIDDVVGWNTYAAKAMEDTVSEAFQGMGDAIVDFASTGKASFSDFADSVIKDLMRIVVQQQIVGPLGSAAGDFISGLFAGPSSAAGTGYAGELSHLMSVSAKGNVFSGPGISEFSNSIVTQPTQFFAKGGNLMGEAGPEAIIPLKRGPDGVLGVRGGGSGVVVNVIESPGSGGRQEQRTENGVNILDVYVERVKSAVASDISSGRGAIPAALSRTYGVSRAQGALR